MQVCMLSLRRPGLLVLSNVDFFEAVQHPRNIFKVKRPESQMVDVVVYVSSALLTTCSALVQLVSCEAQPCLSINVKIKSNSATAAYHWTEENKTNTMVKSSSQTDNYSGSYLFIFGISSFFFAGNIPRYLTH